VGPSIEVNERELKKYRGISFVQASELKKEIAENSRRLEYGIRTTLLCCFNLLECFLNGLAWEFSQDPQNLSTLSKKQKELIGNDNQASFKDKILKYPKIISQKELTKSTEEKIKVWIELFKPYRDSLVHPSPFDVPERFGGYDKLKNIYSMDSTLALGGAVITCEICELIYAHIFESTSNLPGWLEEFKQNVDKISFGFNE